MNNSKFNLGDSVAYLPPVANGDLNHPSVEYGIVMGIGSKYITVKFEDAVNVSEVEPFKLQNLSESK